MADAFIGVNNTPRRITDIWIGDANGRPRKVTEAWIGVGGVPRLWYNGGSYDPPEPLDPSSSFYFDDADTIYTSFGGRNYKKNNSGEAYCFSVWPPSDSTYGFLVSQYKSAVENSCSYNYATVNTADPECGGGSFIMFGHLWYFAVSPYAWAPKQTCNPQSNFVDFRSNPNVPRTLNVDTYRIISKEFLRLYIYS